jgi:Predicted membrane protein
MNSAKQPPSSQGETMFAIFYSPWKKYATFSGRASKAESFIFFLTLIVAWATILINLDFESTRIVRWLWFLATLTPTIALQTRRLHDFGMSGKWLLPGWLFVAFIIALINNGKINVFNNFDSIAPILIDVFFFVSFFLGNILIFTFLFRDGQAGDNKYGARPKSAILPSKRPAPTPPSESPAPTLRNESPKPTQSSGSPWGLLGGLLVLILKLRQNKFGNIERTIPPRPPTIKTPSNSPTPPPNGRDLAQMLRNKIEISDNPVIADSNVSNGSEILEAVADNPVVAAAANPVAAVVDNPVIADSNVLNGTDVLNGTGIFEIPATTVAIAIACIFAITTFGCIIFFIVKKAKQNEH